MTICHVRPFTGSKTSSEDHPCVDPASEGSGHLLVVQGDQGDHHIPGPGEAPRIRGRLRLCEAAPKGAQEG